tara:strand:+ start:467 stop:607 length:141 start_codon:yes stop_codon:yes gene_type:complete
MNVKPLLLYFLTFSLLVLVLNGCSVSKKVEKKCDGKKGIKTPMGIL